MRAAPRARSLAPVIALGIALAAAAGGRVAAADPDPKRKVIVVEYRAGSTALPGVGQQLAAAMSRLTSLAVLGPAQARTVYGELLDQVLVRCAGEAACLAKIGKKLDAVEVVLVGVSELGDVIVTMQRVDVATGEVTGRIADSIAEGEVPTEAQLDAYLQRLLPPGDFRRYGVIAIVANLSDAAVTIGGERRGATPIEPLRLPAPATYEVRVEKDGFVPYTTRIALPPDGEIKVDARLGRPGGGAWYQRWYVLAAAGVLVAGAAGTTIYLATRPPDDNRVPITGTVR